MPLFQNESWCETIQRPRPQVFSLLNLAGRNLEGKRPGNEVDHSNENVLDLHLNASETDFHMKGFAPRLVICETEVEGTPK